MVGIGRLQVLLIKFGVKQVSSCVYESCRNRWATVTLDAECLTCWSALICLTNLDYGVPRNCPKLKRIEGNVLGKRGFSVRLSQSGTKSRSKLGKNGGESAYFRPSGLEDALETNVRFLRSPKQGITRWLKRLIILLFFGFLAVVLVTDKNFEEQQEIEY